MYSAGGDDSIGSIAIVGMSGRFPGARNLADFWQNLCDGVESISFFSDEELALSGIDFALRRRRDYVSAAAVLDDIDRFDATFFGCSPKEAQTLDPQQRLFLECAWEALEDAGTNPETYPGEVGIYAGANISQYLLFNLFPRRGASGFLEDFQTLIGNANDYLATRTSYKLNLTGPSVSVQTACSTSLVSVCLACQSLLSYQCDTALAGGVTVRVPQIAGYVYEPGGILSPDGHCRAFDAKAQGTLLGNGLGIVVLKRMEDAIADNNRIHAVIKGSAINNDGAHKIGYTAPSVDGQAKVIAMAQAVAGISPETITYIEAHGTGTALGDPIEIEALTRVFRAATAEKEFCRIGSIKTNLGHLEAAAGIAGLIKTVLALEHKLLPPSLHFEQPNPEIDFVNSPFFVNGCLSEWKTNGSPRRAGVSSFGIGGTNAHVVLEEAPARLAVTSAFDRPLHLLTLSAKSDEALQQLAAKYESYLAARDSDSFSDICFTANTGRSHFACRTAIVAGSRGEACEPLGSFARGKDPICTLRGHADSGVAPKLAFLFSGEGSQYVGVGRQLYETDATFRNELQGCDRLLSGELEKRLVSVLYPEWDDSAQLDQALYTQPSLFALEYSLAKLWQSWGVQPAFVMGHGVGEYVAACVAGVLNLHDALKLVAARSTLLQRLAQDSAMLAVFADEDCVARALAAHAEHVAIAAVNGPDNIVISGAKGPVSQLDAQFQTQQVRTQPLPVSQAFDSPWIHAMLPEFGRIAAQLSYSPPKIGLISGMTGAQVRGVEMSEPSYWVRQVREPVRFSAGMQELRGLGCETFVEIGPAATLLGWGRRCLPEEEIHWLPSLLEGCGEWRQMLESLKALYVRGANIDWRGFDRDFSRRLVTAPTYPFQRQCFWVGAPEPENTSLRTATRPSKAIHPLLGRRLSSPLREIQFELELEPELLSVLKDHRIYGTPVFPAAAYLEMVHAAATEALRRGERAADSECVVEEVVIREPLLINGREGPRTVHLVLSPEAETRALFQISSLDPGTDVWTVHVTGKVSIGQPASNILTHLHREQIQARSVETISESGAFYGSIAERGLHLGPSFRWIEQIWRRDGEALGCLRLLNQEDHAAGYRIHPGLIDSCFQLLAAALPAGQRDSVYTPVELKRVRFCGLPTGQTWGCAALQQRNGSFSGTIVSDLYLFDDDGSVLMEIQGLVARHARREVLERDSGRVTDMLYRVRWQPQARAQARDGSSQPTVIVSRGQARVPETALVQGRADWLIFADGGGVGRKLADALAQSGRASTLVFAGRSLAHGEDGSWTLDPAKPQHFQQLFQEVRGQSEGCRRVVHLWSLDTPSADRLTPTSLEDAHILSCGSVLHLVQALAGSAGLNSPQLVLVTRGAQPVGAEATPVSTAQGALWGLARVIAREHTALACRCVDLDPSGGANEIDTLVDEIDGTTEENEIAFRTGVRHVARLTPEACGPKGEGRLEPPRKEAFQLQVGSPGSLDSLEFRPVASRPLGAGEVQIRVRATGLNFRDVLQALGVYPGEAGPIGIECAGTIAAVASDIDKFHIGDKVVALATGSFSTVVTTNANLVVPKPARLTQEEAASIPVVFLTAYYALHHLAKLSRGERVLIHAAAGGVGLAAVQLAQRAEAEIFATAGSPEKREYLRRLGIPHVLDSRTLDFAEQVIALTGGEGIDVVLNSLSGEFIPKSLSVLRANGRFLEIGKTGIWNEQQVAQVKREISYFVIALDEVIADGPVAIGAMLRDVMKEFERGSLKPTPVRFFPIEEARIAFRYMAQARQIGKIVITARSDALTSETAASLRSDATYWITGGLGGLGLLFARWMVEKGARNLVLMGRSGPSAAGLETVTNLQAAGARIWVAAGDVSRPEDAANVLAGIRATMPPLGGILHCAGILDDGVVTRQQWSQFSKVMAPKAAGAWNLHLLTQDMPLDFFVLFSSVASLLGPQGQGNYAAANAFLDGLAHYRHSRGLCGLSINWGGWAEVGAAAKLGRRFREGIRAIPPERGLQVLEYAIQNGCVQVAALPVDWKEFSRHVRDQKVAPLVSELIHGSRPRSEAANSPAESSALLGRVLKAPACERRSILLADLREYASRALGVDSSALDVRQPLSDMGLDSLMAIELRNTLVTALGRNLSATLLFDYPTVESLADYVMRECFPASLAIAATNANANDSIQTNLEGVSDEEIATLLAKKVAVIESDQLK